MLNRSSTWQKINFKCTFCGFSFTPMSKCRKRPWKLYKYKNPLLKTYTQFLDHRVQNVLQVSSESSRPWLVQNKPSATIRCVETRLNSSKDNFIVKSFCLSTKNEIEHSIELSLSIRVLYRRIFNLQMQNFSLENRHLINARQPFWWRTTFTDVSNPFLPHPLNGWLDNWAYVGEVGMGDFEVIIFSQTSGVRIFSPHI